MAEERVIDYKYQFVNPPPDDVICPLCLDVVEEPHQFTCCGHHICKKCGDKIKQQATTPHCPMCRHNECTMLPDKYFERNTLNTLLIWCTEVCGRKVELGQLKNHLSRCPCVQDDCPYGCGQQYQRRYIVEHKEKCTKRPVICGYCKYQSTYEVIVNEHYPVCDKFPIICPNECSRDEIERGMLQDHLDKCPFQVVECEFSHVGCQEKVRRCDLAQHLSDNGVHHSVLSSKMIHKSLHKIMEEKDRQLQEKDDELKEVIQQLQERDGKLDDLSKKLEHLECIVANIHGIVSSDAVLNVTMTEFEHKKDDRVRWYSPPFFTHFNGYKMCFEVDFKNSDHNRSLEIYSHIMRGPYDDYLQWPFKGKIIVQLLNQRGGDHHDHVFDYKDSDRGKRVTNGERGELTKSAFDEFSDEPVAWSYLPLDELDYNNILFKYLKDDCLQFKVIVPPPQ